MGYDLHITRNVYWFEGEQNSNDISLDEWLSYIHIDGSELELVDTHGVKVPEAEAKLQVPPGFCEWTSHPENERPWFDYSNGNISTKNPDEPTIMKMISMAKELKAKVQGDDGEVYELSASKEIISRHMGPGLEDENKSKKEKPWWKFW
ncbi:hypothetical protein [Niastella populi]|uniref:Uncharacterized protein n=1 Tax=Niastella populi TaxID=550983 RepID=A0A1V9EK67_9BACT|nr:hypothetical protein [Niastella populi]OQP46543.1 hypothetical protein A4R26_07340 [Niastella populi]